MQVEQAHVATTVNPVGNFIFGVKQPGKYVTARNDVCFVVLREVECPLKWGNVALQLCVVAPFAQCQVECVLEHLFAKRTMDFDQVHELMG